MQVDHSLRGKQGFIWLQDKGYFIANIQLPDPASLERTVEATAKVEKIALETPGVAHTVAIPGQSFVLNANSSNYGAMFIPLKPFHERKGAELSGEAILNRLRARRARDVPEARVLVFGAPAVRGLGNAGGARPGQRRRLQAHGESHRGRGLWRAAGAFGVTLFGIFVTPVFF